MINHCPAAVIGSGGGSGESMEQACQQTVGRRVSISGIALHTGIRAHLALAPAPPGSGVIFCRTDLPGAPEVRAVAGQVVDVRRGTTIAAGAARVHTVEHVMAALHAAQVDNVVVEMDGMEPPILDGSAAPYAELIAAAGVVVQGLPAPVWRATAPIVIEEREATLVLVPDQRFRITYLVAYGATPLDAQFFAAEITAESFRGEVAGARTFCLYKELEAVIAQGLVKGGSLDNAVVIHDGAIISKDGLRWPNELVRHKVLDLIGDLYLVGSRVAGHIIAVKSGHAANLALARAMVAQAAGTVAAGKG